MRRIVYDLTSDITVNIKLIAIPSDKLTLYPNAGSTIIFDINPIVIPMAIFTKLSIIDPFLLCIFQPFLCVINCGFSKVAFDISE